MTLWQRPRHGDGGTSLVIVLIIISTVSLVMGVVLSQVDTNVRTTVALRAQAEDNYGADGATQATLNALRTSGITCKDPSNPDTKAFGSVATPFFVPDSSTDGAINAYAKCTPDAITGVSTSTAVIASTSMVTPPPVTSTAPYLGGGDATLPSYAVMTTGSASGDFGFDISPSAGNKTVCVENGSVGSNKNVDASGSGQILAVRLSPSVTGQGTTDCTTGTGTDPTTKSKLLVTAVGQCKNAGSFTPTNCVGSSAPVTAPPAPALPSGTVAVNPAPVCDNSKKYAAFVPGLYTNVATLNAPCSGTTPDVEWFSPGWYYFDYGSTQWAWPLTLVAGTPLNKSNGAPISGLDPTNGSTLNKLGVSTLAPAPGSCNDPDPGKNPGGGVQGVSMVFAGASQTGANTARSSTAEICASSPSGSPPAAIYGLATSQTITTASGSRTLPAETMCTATGCGSNSLINTDYSNNSGHAEIYIHGYVYATNGQIEITLKNSLGQVFNWGIVVRNLQITINGSSPTQSVIHLPKPYTGVGTIVTTSTPAPTPSISYSTSTSVTYSIRYVNVWTCTVSSLQASGLTVCPHTGSPDVQVKVKVPSDGSALQILSWSNLH